MLSNHIACDLGAESGRVILGRLQDGVLTLEEIHRFATGVHRVGDSLRWDVVRIFEELKIGLRKVADLGIHADGVSVDSWGVDYALFRSDNPLLALPHHYRDARTDGTYECALKEVPAATIFEETGIQFMSINTLYQLIAEVRANSTLLEEAEQFLTIGDYLNYRFCGVAKAEVSLASTSQLYNPRTKQWSSELQRRFHLPARIFPEIVNSATVLGAITPEIAAETSLNANMQVIATCSHDTGCAVAAVPAEGDDWAYLSSGTWSLLGVELPEPLINADVLAANFTNEIGLGGTSRFLKNTAGLWILQECRRTWKEEGREFSYDDLTNFAEDADSLRSLIDPADPRFLKPDDMPARIVAYCEATGQPVPQLPGEFVRCILESLALLYRRNIETLRALTGRAIHRLHIVGGGSKNRLLNQFAANATGLPVVAGPVEATAIGNLLIQALAMGQLADHAALRETVRRSFPVETLAPKEGDVWEEAYQRFCALEPTH